MRAWGDRDISHYSSCMWGIATIRSHRFHTRPLLSFLSPCQRVASSYTEPVGSPATGGIACERTLPGDPRSDWQANGASRT